MRSALGIVFRMRLFIIALCQFKNVHNKLSRNGTSHWEIGSEVIQLRRQQVTFIITSAVPCHSLKTTRSVGRFKEDYFCKWSMLCSIDVALYAEKQLLCSAEVNIVKINNSNNFQYHFLFSNIIINSNYEWKCNALEYISSQQYYKKNIVWITVLYKHRIWAKLDESFDS